MQSFLIGLGIILILIILLYNFLISKKNQVENIFGSVAALLKKRFDLIPSLVATVQEAMKHEKSTLEEITALRAKASNPKMDSNKLSEIDAKFTPLLNSLMLSVEAYPQIKANENVIQLQRSLNEVEEQLSAARRAYNQAVTDYNNAIEMFPNSILANYMKYERKMIFAVSQNERKNPNVKDLFEK
jgi:LemA protein